MESRNKLDELITKYLSDQANEEDKVHIGEWINSNEHNREYFEESKKAWRLMAVKQAVDKIDINQEWDNFQQTVKRKETLPASINEHQKTAYEITSEKQPHLITLSRIIVLFTVAASVMFLIISGWSILINRKQPGQSVVHEQAKKEKPLANLLRHEINTSGKNKKLILREGSQITLYDKSMVSYQEPFGYKMRDITLTGKADFEVAKDVTKPFTVLSHDILTTAIGTRFTVTALEHGKNIIVKLYEGKVVVKSAYNAKRKLKYGYYMLPGQEFIYDIKNFTAIVRNIQEKNHVANRTNNENISYDDPLLPASNKGSWYMFNNQSLEQVFNQLEEMYDADIQYSKRDIRNMYFIGKFERSDSLDYILKQIVSLNNLQLTKTKDGFIITRQHQ